MTRHSPQQSQLAIPEWDGVPRLANFLAPSYAQPQLRLQAREWLGALPLPVFPKGAQ